MPWYSSVAARENGGVEVAVHYELYRGPNEHSHSKRQSSAAILTIDKDNVNVIGKLIRLTNFGCLVNAAYFDILGPACIAQRLMFAAVAAAQAVPKKNSDDFDTDEEASKDASDSPMVEEVAKAFLHSVDRYMEVNEDQPTSFDTSKQELIKNVKLLSP